MHLFLIVTTASWFCKSVLTLTLYSISGLRVLDPNITDTTHKNITRSDHKMPRNRAIDYPQVHPPSVQPHLGLAPPQASFANRFSFQVTPTEAVSPNADEQLDACLTARSQEQRQSRVPPLPLLPEHLSGPHNTHAPAAEAVLPSQRSGKFQFPDQTQGLQQQEQQSQQTRQFRPNITRSFKQMQHTSPTPSYEASQAAYQQVQNPQARMQENEMYPVTHNTSQPQFSAHALPMQNTNQPFIHNQPLPEEQDTPNQQQTTRSDDKPKKEVEKLKLEPIHLEPDSNPLSPASPITALSPTRSVNMGTYPLPSDLQFPQATSYTQPGPVRGGTWQHGLGSCAEPTTCLSALVCPCVVYGRTQYRLSLKSEQKDPTNMLGYSAISGSCLAWSVLCGVNILLTAIQHRRVRKAYDMESQAGNLASDCVKSTCCCCCILAQDEKEIKFREEHGRKADASGMTQAYTSPQEMKYASLR